MVALSLSILRALLPEQSDGSPNHKTITDKQK